MMYSYFCTPCTQRTVCLSLPVALLSGGNLVAQYSARVGGSASPECPMCLAICDDCDRLCRTHQLSVDCGGDGLVLAKHSW
jgi:hypothetical protein